jgi:hypothetical protein
MPLFVRQPADPVEAVQWFPGLPVAGISDELPGHPGSPDLLPSPPHAYLVTPKGRFTVFASDWIITEPTGTQHVCHDSLFRQSYQPVEENLPEDSEEALLLRKAIV